MTYKNRSDIKVGDFVQVLKPTYSNGQHFTIFVNALCIGYDKKTQEISVVYSDGSREVLDPIHEVRVYWSTQNDPQ